MPKSPPFAQTRTADYKRALAWFCFFALLWTTCLLFAGGFTTSIQAGMAFLDWPLSNGSLNPDGWLTQPDMRAEHSHRLLGAIVGLLTFTLGAWIHLREERRWLRRLALLACGLVVLQGLLGGARVLFDRLNTGGESNFAAQAFAVAHACTAQIFLCVLVSIAVASSRRWIERHGGLQRAPSRALRGAGLAACGVVIVQLLLGALMRHNQAWAAIPTFPFTPEGGLVPAHWDFRVAIHFAHRAGAIVVAVALLAFAGRLWAARHFGRILGAGAVLLMFLLSLQIYLGALIVWTLRNPHAATLHMLAGAFTLAACWGLTFLAHRFRFADATAPAPAELAAPARGAAGAGA